MVREREPSQRTYRHVEYVECFARGQKPGEGWFCDIKHGDIDPRSGGGPFEQDVDVDRVVVHSFPARSNRPEPEGKLVKVEASSVQLFARFGGSSGGRGVGFCEIFEAGGVRSLVCYAGEGR